MEKIVAVAQEYKLPIIADEVYYDLSFDPTRQFHSFAKFGSEIPLLTIGSLSKLYCVPGWRCGWVIAYNKDGYFDKVVKNLATHQMIQLHINSLV